MTWQQLTLDWDEAGAQRLADWLQEAGALSVTLSDAADQPLYEPPPGAEPLWRATRVSALFDGAADVPRIAAELGEHCAPAALPPWRLETLPERDWVRESVRDLAPMRFGRRLWVCPLGSDVPDPDAVLVRLDPGLAFGTGTHPTTALCLEWLDAVVQGGETVLDYGCGSGILAIAALQLGAARALGVDLDPQALHASRDNAERNALSERLALRKPAELGDVRADLVVANILAGPLLALAPELARSARAGARLALSGILRHQVATVAAAYAPSFALDPVQSRDEWALLTGRRTESG